MSRSKIDLKGWQTWVFIVSLVGLMVWVYLGYGYYSLDIAGVPDSDLPANQELVKWIGSDNIRSNPVWWCGAIVLTLSAFVVSSGACVSKLLKHRSLVKSINDLLAQIPALPDDDIKTHCRTIGLDLDAQNLKLEPLIVNTAYPHNLARVLGWLMYFDHEQIALITKSGQYTSLHQLADVLLDNWTVGDIEKFVQTLMAEKEYLGKAMDEALQRRDLERRVVNLQKEIDACRNRENNVSNDLASAKFVSRRLEDFQTLMVGQSTMWRRLKGKFASLKSGVTEKIESINI